jgi:antitoxin (DNA-binding transcriptional repressor) of toxin-antitoxin stability system
MNASKFKEQCLALPDNEDPGGVLITKRGKPVARLIPAKCDCASRIGSMKRKIRIKGNILSTGVRWNAQS